MQKLLFSIAAVSLAGASHAATVVVGDGIEWSWTSSSVGLSSGSLTLHSDVSGSLLGDVRLAAFQLKSDSGIAFASASVPGGGWTWKKNELNANGCTGGAHSFNTCFEAIDIASSVSDASDFGLTVNFVLASGVLPDTLHFKADWNQYDPCLDFHFSGSGKNKSKVCDGGWKKSGSLISEDFTRTEVPTEVPIPGTLGLLGLGLAGLGALRRRAN